MKCLERNLAVTLVLSSLISVCGHAQAPQSHGVYVSQDGFIDSDGVLLYYVSMGRGKPLIVLHGGPGASHDYLLPSLLPLMRTHQVIFLDERGSGRSGRLDDTPQEYNVDAMAADVEAVRKALGLGTISLLGHSCGGLIAEAYALKYGEHLDHLILNSTFASTSHMNRVLAAEKTKIPPEKLAELNKLEQAGLFGKGDPWERNRYAAAYQALAWGWGYFPLMYGKHPDAAYEPGAQAPTNWTLYRTMWGDNGEFRITGNLRSVEYVDQLGSINVPTLVIAGDHDEIGPELAEELHNGIPGSKMTILPDSGHLNFVDQPALYLRAVEDFLSDKP
jgi:proline iminopeptidase